MAKSVFLQSLLSELDMGSDYKEKKLYDKEIEEYTGIEIKTPSDIIGRIMETSDKIRIDPSILTDASEFRQQLNHEPEPMTDTGLTRSIVEEEFAAINELIADKFTKIFDVSHNIDNSGEEYAKAITYARSLINYSINRLNKLNGDTTFKFKYTIHEKILDMNAEIKIITGIEIILLNE